MTNIFTSDNWRAELDGSNILWLHLDKKDDSANTLNRKVLEELASLIEEIKALTPKGLIILSDKKSGFIAGADIKEFTAIKTKEEALELISYGQSIMDSIEALPYTTVAMIHGFCLGGGMELALACNYRVAVGDSATKLGLPEVMLGIHPGFGGTVRLPKLIGTGASMNMILSGQVINVRWAKKIGLVDITPPHRHLKKAAVDCIKNPPKRKKIGLTQKIIDKPIVRSFIKKTLHKRIESKAPARYYPAPHNVIDLWARSGSKSERLKNEAHSVSELITGDTAKNLIRLFFLRERLKGLGKDTHSHFKPRHIHVIGAGVMGGDIAAWCVLNGMTVTLQDREAKFIAPAISRAHRFFSHKLKDEKYITDAMDRLIPDVGGTIGVHNADVVIEAIFEDLKAKRELFKSIEPLVGEHTVLASNTSSIPIEEIAKGLKDKTRLVGIHFFNPVAKMPLVEIVAGSNTDKSITEKASTFTTIIGKLPLPVKSTPGFLVNRVLMPYLLEAVTMVDEGITPALIDRAATDFGMPMGPILLADTVGLDICLHVAEVLAESPSDQEIMIPKGLKEKVEKNHLGRKTGRGYYKYKNSQAIELLKKTKTPDSVIEDRLILSLINESAHSLHDKVAEDSDLIDAGMVFGTGFAPFRGGPLHYLNSYGVDLIKDKLKKLEKIYGYKFHPSKGLK